ncbi:MAG: hypothetical protein AAF203_01585 [Pseudomonadota bacterium]
MRVLASAVTALLMAQASFGATLKECETETFATLEEELECIGAVKNSDFERPISGSYKVFEAMDPDAIIIRLTTMDHYLRFADLQRMHISSLENGSSGVFLAAPQISAGVGVSAKYQADVKAAADGVPAEVARLMGEGMGKDEAVAEAKKAVSAVQPDVLLDGVGYFFTKGAGNNLDTVDTNLFHSNGTTGHGSGYPCGTYGKAGESVPFNLYDHRAQMNYKHFNADVVAKMQGANAMAEAAGAPAPFPTGAILQAIARGTRMMAMSPDELGQIQTNCAPLDKAKYDATNPSHFLSASTYDARWTDVGGGVRELETTGEQYYTWLPYAFDVPSYSGYVQPYAIFRNYKKGDWKKRKADALDAYGPSFGGHFIWERAKDEKATVTNSQWLISLYNKYCEESEACSGYVKY